MLDRKEQLAFRLDKIYFLKRHSGDAFKQLHANQRTHLQTLAALENDEESEVGGPVQTLDY